jgi:hypothetical protein
MGRASYIELRTLSTSHFEGENGLCSAFGAMKTLQKFVSVHASVHKHLN